jgi:membrane protease YdiL (CAAX protease family)
MIQREPLIKQFPNFLKLIFLVLVILVCLLFTLIFGIVVAIPIFGPEVFSQIMDLSEMSVLENIELQKYFQIISQLGTFIFPALLFAFLVHRRIWDYLKLNIKPRLFTIILATLLIMAILPFINWLVQINESLQLPEFMAGIERWMRNSEEQAMKLTEAFLSDTSPGGFIINLLMIGMLAAIGEEFLFRGVILRIFRDWTGNTHVAVWISAILFSALHLQFFGFLPRMILGVVLGYMFVWSGSLWVPVITHFINNAAAVSVAFLYYRGKIQTDMESFGSTDNTAWIIGSLIISLLLLITIFRYERSIRKTTGF